MAVFNHSQRAAQTNKKHTKVLFILYLLPLPLPFPLACLDNCSRLGVPSALARAFFTMHKASLQGTPHAQACAAALYVIRCLALLV